MANKKEIIQWVTIQINKKMKKSDIDLSKNIENIVEKNIKDRIHRFFITNELRTYSRFDEKLGWWIPSISDKVEKLCMEARIYDSIRHVLYEVDTMYENYKAETDEINIYNNKLKDLLSSFKEGMLLISNGDLADYAKAFIESIRE